MTRPHVILDATTNWCRSGIGHGGEGPGDGTGSASRLPERSSWSRSPELSAKARFACEEVVNRRQSHGVADIHGPSTP